MPTFNKVKSGEVAGSATAAQMPDISCRMARFIGVIGNAGMVYIGGEGVTIPDGETDVTSGFELDAGVSTPWFPVTNLNVFYRICDNAGDDVLYQVLE